MTTLESLPSILPATPESQELAIAPIVLAFASDPVARWVYPNAHQYRTFFPRFVRAFGGRAFPHHTAHYVQGFHGASLWLPPGVEPDESALMPLLEETVNPPRRDDLFAMLEQMGASHPAKPHWYLPLIGVDPGFQRRGFGSALLAPMLAAFDREQVAAYLEASSAASIPLYERHGFTITNEIQAGSSPTMYAMVREPR
jgi:ribosomal protein S18 acetylase RimI-like enzyme